MGRSDVVWLGAGGGTSSVISTTAHPALIHTISRGKRISFIQKEYRLSDSNINSIPAPGARPGLPDRPCVRCSGVTASSTAKLASPMVTVGAGVTGLAVGPASIVGVVAGDGEGAGVTTSEGVEPVAAGTVSTVGVGVESETGEGVSTSAEVPPQAIATDKSNKATVSCNT